MSSIAVRSSRHGKEFLRNTPCARIVLLEVYADQYGEVADAPYWNIERSNVGMLAAACWKNGWVALEEFSTEKEKDDEENGSARCDLWVSSQNGKSNYAIEAKKGWSSLDSKNIIENLKELLIGELNLTSSNSACNDAMKLSEDEGDERMGIAFMHLYLPKDKNKNAVALVEKVQKEVEDYASKKYSNKYRPDFVYLYLKDNGVTSDTGSIIPGVIIAGKVI